MAETRKTDEDQLIDHTLSLFQNAIADTRTFLPPVQFSWVLEPKNLAPLEPPEKRPASLIGHAVSIARTVAGFAPKAPHGTRQGREQPVGDARSDPLLDQVLSMVANVPIDQPIKAEAASPSSHDRAEAALLSLPQHVDKPASKDVPPLERPTQEEPQARSFVEKLVISEQKTVLVKKVVISEHKAVQAASPSLQPPVAKQPWEKPFGDARSDPSIDQVLSKVDGPKLIEASPLNTAEAGELRKPVDGPVSKDAPPLEGPILEELPSLIDGTQSRVAEAAPTALPLPEQVLMSQLSPKERLDMDRAEIRKRVVAFKHHQQLFQRDREEYYATTISKVRTIQGKAKT
jgi:hypothetical protein